jgi:putative serine protease PepD
MWKLSRRRTGDDTSHRPVDGTDTGAPSSAGTPSGTGNPSGPDSRFGPNSRSGLRDDPGTDATTVIPAAAGSQHRYGDHLAGAGPASPYAAPPPYPSSGPYAASGPDAAPGPDAGRSDLPGRTDPGGAHDTAAFGGCRFGEEPTDAPLGADHHRAPGRPARGVVAGILAAALAVGAVAGVAGAAGFTAVDNLVGDDTTTSSQPAGRTSTVVDRNDPAPDPGSVERVAASVLPSVVKINVTGSSEAGSGSGIVISSDGEILTNNHVASVAQGGGGITVNFNDGTTKRARILGTDPVTDLAVIKAEDVSGLQPATIGRSTDIAVGENVVAIGSPFGLQATVTSGIVSALNRPVSVGGSEGAPGQQPQDTTYPAIQTDAAINPGNSGGPLVDLDGDVVGVNSSIRTASSGGLDTSSGGNIGLGFAIPIDNVWPVVQQLRRGETPTHARMGVSVTAASEDGGLLTGAGVQSVEAGSAAAEAGVRKGDVVTKVDGQVITDSTSLVATVRGHRPGQTVTLTLVRGGDTRTVKVSLDSDAGSTDS